MDINVLDIKGQETGRKVTLNENIFGIEPNDHVLYLAVKQYLADQRQGTAKSKERSEHAGSTRKLGRQKGGGGARRGDINSPVLRRWWSVFGPKPRDYSFKLNKKVKVLARKSAFGLVRHRIMLSLLLKILILTLQRLRFCKYCKKS